MARGLLAGLATEFRAAFTAIRFAVPVLRLASAALPGTGSALNPGLPRLRRFTPHMGIAIASGLLQLIVAEAGKPPRACAHP